MTQEEALKIMKMGNNVFLTGAPGAGKTFVLNRYLDFLYQAGIETAVTASTGIAATHIGGMTIHSWSGIGVKKFLSDEEVDRLTQNERLYKRYQNTKVLVIDEISMLSAVQFEMLDILARQMRRRDEPFGGMQVILSGDFFQLPPVFRRGDDERYAFESESWLELNPVILYLDENYRHSDEVLRELLLGIRSQNLSEEILFRLEERHFPENDDENDDEKTRLYTHNIDVDSLNESRLDEIDSKEHIFEMTDSGNKASVKNLKNWCLAPETLRLKEGAQVMLVKNDPAGKFVNGTRGVFKDLEDGLPVVETLEGDELRIDYASWIVEENGKVKAEVSQVPIRLAWAITVHKSQGMTLDEARIDLSKAFAPGQGYVALSRVRKMAGLYLSGFNERALAVDDRALRADGAFLARSKAASERLEQIGDEAIDKKIKSFVTSSGGKMPESKTDESRKDALKRRKVKSVTTSTYEVTKDLAKKEYSIKEIAKERGIKEKTVIGHLEKLKETEKIDLSYMLPDIKKKIDEFNKIHLAFEHLKEFKLTPIKKYLEKHKINANFEDIRLVRLMLDSKKFKRIKKRS